MAIVLGNTVLYSDAVIVIELGNPVLLFNTIVDVFLAVVVLGYENVLIVSCTLVVEIIMDDFASDDETMLAFVI